jgi:hypothetical protein
LRHAQTTICSAFGYLSAGDSGFKRTSRRGCHRQLWAWHECLQRRRDATARHLRFTVAGYYHADTGGTVPFQGIILNAGLKIDFFTSGLAALYVPDRKVLGGNFGLSVTVPVGHVEFAANVGIGPLSASRQVDGWGLGDVVPRMQLGWQNGDLAYTIWL